MYRLKRRGLKTQPCFIPLETENFCLFDPIGEKISMVRIMLQGVFNNTLKSKQCL